MARHHKSMFLNKFALEVISYKCNIISCEMGFGPFILMSLYLKVDGNEK
jgi:hypothetical protein